MINDFLKTIPQFLLPKHALTLFAGAMAGVKIPAVKNHLIRRFVAKYGVDMNEAKQENPYEYACFNDFFIRHLKANCRPLAQADIISPVDGLVSEFGSISEGSLLQAKGRYYSVREFLASDAELCEPFMEGQFVTLYLAPKDYHRIHMPLTARLKEMVYVPGKLFSVQPTTVRVIPKLFARNERLVVFFDTPAGLMAMILVGATIVGAIATSWHGEIKRGKNSTRFIYEEEKQSKMLQRGEEMGYFKLGSTVVLMFAQEMPVNWVSELKPGNIIRYGQELASLSSKK